MPESTERCARCGATSTSQGSDALCAVCLIESAFDNAESSGAAPPSGPLLAFKDYELLGEIARGGMGVVYRARQISLNRTVAVKMILGGHLANAAEVQRFRAEAEMAARLQQPNIVAIHEVGEHAGQPFFSMDFVEGRNLAQLVHDEPLPSRKAAGYLKTIAEAVQYAHSRGVLHRDLKPSNILIDADDQPRITDFGLAKRLDVDASLTTTGQVLGSPSFIPPEQAAGEKDASGPASDVYSMGAILYHCLTGRAPFVAETVPQTLRLVAEQEPVSPRLLNASVPRDLETICLKCLEKDPARRFPTAQALAEDLGRFLKNEPIHARPVGIAIKVHRWCSRNKALAMAASVIVALLLAVAMGSSIALVRISRERSQARTFAKFLGELLETAGPSFAQGRDTTLVKEFLAKASDRVNHLTDQPEAAASIRLAIGKTYIDLGDYTNALAMTQEALRLRREYFGPRHLAVAEALNNMGPIMDELGDPRTAARYDREALEMRKELLGTENLDVATSMSNLGYRLQKLGDLAGAEPLLQDALRIRLKALGPESREVGMSRNNLAMVLWSLGNFDEAESQFRDTLEIFKKLHTGNHPAVATLLNNVGEVVRNMGNLDEAEEMMRKALEMRAKVLGPRNGYTAYSQHNLANILDRQGNLDAAMTNHQQALNVLMELPNTNHPFVAETLSSYAVTHGRKGDFAEAEELYRKALAVFDQALGTNSPGSTETLERLGTTLAVRGQPAEAAMHLTNALVILKNSAGSNHSDLVPPLCHLAWVLNQRGDSAAAEVLRTEAKTIGLKGGRYGTRSFLESHYDLADLLQVQKRYGEAEALLLDAHAFLESSPKTKPVFDRLLLKRLSAFYQAWDRAEPGTGKDTKAAEWRTKLSAAKPGTGEKNL